MRYLLLPFCFLTVVASAQQTIHSTANGSASNPLIWDCFCFPTTNDIVIVNHQVTMDVDWAITAGGRIDVSPGASLLQDADRQLLVDGTGSQLNVYGSAWFTDIAFTNGSGGTNSGQLAVDRALYFQAGTTYTNSGTISGIDSLLTEGTFTNTGNFYAGDFLNTGTFTTSGHIDADSMGNTGTFTATNGYMTIATYGNTGTFSLQSQGFMQVSGNWYNAGDFNIAAGPDLYVGTNAYTGDTLGGTANLVNNGTMVVTGDFGNSDNVNGSGDICVGGQSANVGAVTGTLDFCDNTGTGGFDANFGTIGAGVTFCTSGCHLGLAEQELATAGLYPNPATTTLHITSDQSFDRAIVFALSGAMLETIAIQGNSFAVDQLEAGVYFIVLKGMASTRPLRVVVE